MRKSYSDKELAELVDHIKQDIIFGRLRPRERLIEDDLSTRFGASRHLVRSAFSDLEKLGLVTRRPNKVARCPEASAQVILDEALARP